MRVGYLLKRFPQASQTFVLDELLELERQGLDLVIVAGRPGDGQRPPALRAAVHFLDDSADAAAAAAAVLVHERVDHVHAHFATWGAATAHEVARITGLPYSFTAHATDIYRAGLDLDALAERLADARFVVTVTEHNRTHLLQLLAERGRTGRVARLYNGVDLGRLAAYDGPREPDLVVGVGRLVAKKGFVDLLGALAIARDAGRPLRAVIASEGPERPGLEEQIRELHLSDLVELAGSMPRDGVAALMRRAAVFALPCVVTADGDRDALPTVLLEAMALGTPVVSTLVSGVPEMVDHPTSGLLVAPNDPAALAGALRQLTADPTYARACAVHARKRVEQDFALTTNVARLHQWFRSGGPG